ncbi:hypothetical protein EI555_021326, partial [Monodon monoceros]
TGGPTYCRCERPARKPRHPGQGGGGPAWRCGRLPVAGEGWGLCSDGGARVVRRCPGRRVWTVGPEKPRSRTVAGASVAAPLVAGCQGRFIRSRWVAWVLGMQAPKGPARAPEVVAADPHPCELEPTTLPGPWTRSWPPADGSPSAGLELFSICTWPCRLAPAHWQGVQAPGQGGHRGPGCPAWGHVPTGLSSQVSNGASPQDERTTSLLVFSFLQSCPHSRCRRELEMLGHKLPVRAAHDDELQTDGNWCSHFRVEGATETGRRRASLRGPDVGCGAFGLRSTLCPAGQASPSPKQQGGWSLSALGHQLRTWESAHSWEPQSPWKLLFWGRGSDGVQEGRAWHLGRAVGCWASSPGCGYPGITGPSPARPLRLVPCSHRPHWAVDAGPTPFLEQERGVSGASSDPPPPTPFCTLDSETQEEVVRDIARQLAQIGDRMECSICPGLVAGLAAQFGNTSLSEEDRRRCLAAALQQLTQLYPADVDREKTLLLLTLLVAKKVADHSPAVLQDVFHTTVTFINQNLLAYVRNLVQNEMD